MKIWVMSVGDCENSGVALLCATKEIAERELFKARDKLIEEWEKGDKFAQKQVADFCRKNNKPIWVDDMYKKMITALFGNDYKKWDNYPHECPYIYESEVLDD